MLRNKSLFEWVGIIIVTLLVLTLSFVIWKNHKVGLIKQAEHEKTLAGYEKDRSVIFDAIGREVQRDPVGGCDRMKQAIGKQSGELSPEIETLLWNEYSRMCLHNEPISYWPD